MTAVVAGGATRQDSVRAGLAAIATEAPDYVLVHDAARPLIPKGAIPSLLAALEALAGAIPAQPVADKLKRAAAGVIAAMGPLEGLSRAHRHKSCRAPVQRSLTAAAFSSHGMP